MKALLGTMVALTGVALVVACGGGAGPLVTTSSGNGRDDPGVVRDKPPGTSDLAGGDCLQCDVTYECPSAGTVQSITLSSSQGTCTQAAIDFVCSGGFLGGVPCTGSAGGSFTCGSLTCIPQQQALPGGSSGGSSSSGGTPGGGTGFADGG